MTQASRSWFGALSTATDDELTAAPDRTGLRRAATIARIAAMAGAFAAVSALVVTTSQATFTDTTDSSTNSVVAGDIDLVDDDSGSAIFSLTDVEPGQTTTDCILVTYQGSIPDPSQVRIYSGGYTDSGDFATYLNLTVEEGTGGSYGDCTGFSLENTIETGGTLSAFGTAHTNYANGAGVWDPAATPASKTYRITIELDAATPNAEEGESVTGLTFTWEIQN